MKSIYDSVLICIKSRPPCSVVAFESLTSVLEIIGSISSKI